MTRTAYLDHPGPIPLAHQGFDTSGREHSMSAFQAAVDLGYRYLETDVHATSDGVLVSFHDETLDRVTDRTGRIPRLPWSEVSRARIRGLEEIPRLEVLLDTWPEARFNIDIKTPGAIGPLVRVIERARAHDRVCVTSFSDARRRAALRRLTRPVVTSAGRGVTARAVLGTHARAAGWAVSALRDVDGLQVPVTFRGIPVVTAETVRLVHAAGRFLHVWTINDPAQMHQLLDLGVDGIVTDRADLLKQVLTERGQWA